MNCYTVRLSGGSYHYPIDGQAYLPAMVCRIDPLTCNGECLAVVKPAATQQPATKAESSSKEESSEKKVAK
jgi:hypothetical protein